jgi:hypothetical protein
MHVESEEYIWEYSQIMNPDNTKYRGTDDGWDSNFFRNSTLQIGYMGYM